MSRHPFDVLIDSDGERVRVARAALLFAQDEYPELAVGTYLQRLAALAERVSRLKPASAPDRIEAMRRILVEDENYRGDTQDYYDPRNSYLNDVMDRRRGLPITLAAIWIDVAGQLGWGFEGVNFPGHYLVRCPGEADAVLVAPFDGGRTVERAELPGMLSNLFGKPTMLMPEHLQTATPLMTLTRMLNNLRSVYTSRGQWGKAMRVIERMLAIEPGSEALRAEFEELARRQAEMN